MIIRIQKFILIVLLTVLIIGCFGLPSTPNQPNVPSANFSATPQSTIFTLNATEMVNQLKFLLRSNGGCNLPCFWGIQPDQSSYDELLDLFKQLGKDGFETNIDNRHYVSSSFRTEERGGLYVEFQADVQNEVVKDIVVSIGGVGREGYSIEDWRPYTLEEVLRVYGIPSTVEIYLDILGSSNQNVLSFDIRVRYDDLNTSLLYIGGNRVDESNLTESSVIICPHGRLDSVKIHLGKNPINYEPDGKVLSDVTDLTIEEFYQTFIDNPSACLVINRQAIGK